MAFFAAESKPVALFIAFDRATFSVVDSVFGVSGAFDVGASGVGVLAIDKLLWLSNWGGGK